ncbi:MAG TPA: CPBP family intramembrane glutamic endopeptidase [Rhodanobacteraceae bacterium]|nr:CPBP family intramembrane glutamic endopeptidase [Rhodanobacteraceae bacterium]
MTTDRLRAATTLQAAVDFVQKLDRRIRASSMPGFVLWNVALSYAVVLPLAAFCVTFGLEAGPKFPDGVVEMFFATCVLGPPLETFVHQWLPIRILQRFGCRRSGTLVLVSAVGFGAAHWYSAYYIAAATLIGVVLGYAFLACDESGRSPFLTVSLIHAARNLVTFAFVVLGS